MADKVPQELVSILEDLRQQLATLSGRVANLEKTQASVSAVAPSVPAAAAAPAALAQTRDGITEEELLAISGALAAYLGVRVHIRQIRLISSRAWASEGRVSIQASHRLHS
jgi:methylmalonyl-CoA carboxyltransferase large subunit